MKYWAESFSSYLGGGWAIDTDATKALRRARAFICETAKSERGSYVIEFPDDAQLEPLSDLTGGWRSLNGVLPLRVVKRNKIQASVSDNTIMGRES